MTVAGEFDVNSPVTNAYLSAACGNALPGWPCDKPLDELRAAMIRETVPAKRKELLDSFQVRAFEAHGAGPAWGILWYLPAVCLSWLLGWLVARYVSIPSERAIRGYLDSTSTPLSLRRRTWAPTRKIIGSKDY